MDKPLNQEQLKSKMIPLTETIRQQKIIFNRDNESIAPYRSQIGRITKSTAKFNSCVVELLFGKKHRMHYGTEIDFFSSSGAVFISFSSTSGILRFMQFNTVLP